jgi:hypothetical protein
MGFYFTSVTTKQLVTGKFKRLSRVDQVDQVHLIHTYHSL